jgi:threonine synthase
MPESALTHLECPECGKKYDTDRGQSYCEDFRSPLLARYDLDKVAAGVTPAQVSARPRGLWRRVEFLPVGNENFRVMRGKGVTPGRPARLPRGRSNTGRSPKSGKDRLGPAGRNGCII